MATYPVEQAWTHGFDAATRLLPSSSNPYKVGGDLHEAWFDGWCSGSEPDQEGAKRIRINAEGPKGAKRPTRAICLAESKGA